MNEHHSLTARRIAIIQSLMVDTPMSSRELAIAASMSQNRACLYLRHLHESGKAHIAAWERINSGAYAARYLAGAGKDKSRPRPKSRAKRAADERERMKRIRKDPEAYGLYLSKQRARHAKVSAVKVPNSWFGALPGARVAVLNAEG